MVRIKMLMVTDYKFAKLKTGPKVNGAILGQTSQQNNVELRRLQCYLNKHCRYDNSTLHVHADLSTFKCIG